MTNDPMQRAYILSYAEHAVMAGRMTPEAALVEAAEAWDRKVAAEKALVDAYEKVMSERKEVKP
jgi:hypothetical protein